MLPKKFFEIRIEKKWYRAILISGSNTATVNLKEKTDVSFN